VRPSTYFCRWPVDKDPGELLRLDARTARDGVSVFPSFQALCRYIAEREVGTAGYIALELEGQLTGEVDLDAAAGAVLIRVTRVVGALPFHEVLSA
jgi:hypothetical protein